MRNPDVPHPEFDDYPSPAFIEAADVARNVSKPDDADTIIALREAGVATIRAKYWGGHDRSNYDIIGLYDEEGIDITRSDEVKEVVEDLDYQESPEVVAVDQAMGGPFNGAGAGQTYGGVIEMRLDTLETRKINEFYEEMHSHDHRDADWDAATEEVIA
jgi:hypothetical protein